MKYRFFEKYIRKKKIRIDYLYIPLFIVEIVFAVALIAFGVWVDTIPVREPTSKTESLGSMFFLLAFLISINPLRSLYRIFKSSIGKSEIISKDIIFLDQKSFSYNFFKIDELYFYQFLTEPYINQVILLTDTFNGDPYKEAWTKLHFNFPASMAYFRKHKKEYWVCQEQYLADPDKTDQKTTSMRFSAFRSKKNKNGREWERYRYCVTFEKAQALNRVFDLVSPPVFKVVVNEKQRRLISIHPIEGREYPEEVCELLEKINGMYP